MAIATYISVTCAASPMSPDPSATPPPELPSSRRPPTKIILPKKKPMKWSTGVAPGDYGGPPTTTKLRKYWGGDEPDPLTSDDYIWNKDFMGRFQRMIKNPNDEDDSSPQSSTDKESSAGFLSFNRVMSLDSMEVDLSKELTKPSKAVSSEQPVQVPSKSSTSSLQKWRLAPTRREQEKWDRATKASTGGSEVLMREARQPQGDPEILAAQSREQYFKLKKKLQILTVGIGGVGLVSSYISYTPEIAASYGAGFIGSLIYIRMLGSTVDSMADGARGLIKGAIGQPRLLVPVVLVMIYNRWNAILVPDYGILHLELIPMLVGFFTYKIATFFQAIEEGVNIISTKNQT